MSGPPVLRCFACGRRLGRHPVAVDTHEDQVVLVGRECAKLVRKAGERGYQPTGRHGARGPRLYWMDCICPSVCDCQSPETEPALCSNACPVHNLHPDPCPECPARRHRNGAGVVH